MPFPTSISTDKLVRLIGTANTPALIDVRTDEDFAADARLVPGSRRREPHDRVLAGQTAVVGREQVPALGLTAQAFLMTIVLGTASPPISVGARYAPCALSIIVAIAAVRLMHDQRARAINLAELAKRISYRLSLTNVLGGSFGLGDAVPGQGADAQNVWATNRIIYGIWQVCMYLFAIADAVVIFSLLKGTSWFT